jgi:hypothetical protein
VSACRELMSRSGLTVMLLIALPWWISAALTGGDEFVDAIVIRDQLLWYFRTAGWSWRMIPDTMMRAVAVTLPWSLLVPFAVRSAMRAGDPRDSRGLRLSLIWLATVFVIIAVSGQQRDRYYLPLCPAVALLVGWWYSRWAWARRALVFAATWIIVVAVGGAVDRTSMRDLNLSTDLEALRATAQKRSGILYGVDVPELALTFNLDRPVVGSKDYRSVMQQAEQDGRLLISERALWNLPNNSCIREIAAGTINRRRLLLVSTIECRLPLASSLPSSSRSGAKEK